jgi:uncharacterized glyoxalase superfamily protein PhnB
MTTTTPPGTWPTVSYRDADAALAFLADVLGFTAVTVHRGGPERPVTHAELRWPGGGGVMLGSEPVGGRWSGGAGAPGTSAVYLSTSVAGLDAVAARVRDAGWVVLRSLAETDYGAREMAVADPEGNAWSVGTYLGADA